MISIDLSRPSFQIEAVSILLQVSIHQIEAPRKWSFRSALTFAGCFGQTTEALVVFGGGKQTWKKSWKRGRKILEFLFPKFGFFFQLSFIALPKNPFGVTLGNSPEIFCAKFWTTCQRCFFDETCKRNR